MKMHSIRGRRLLFVSLGGALFAVVPLFAEEPLPSPDKVLIETSALIKEISPAELELLRSSGASYRLIDVREEREYLAGHLDGALWIPRGTLEFDIGKAITDPDQKLVLYCRTGKRGALATKTLNDMGYKNASNLQGGFADWVKAGNSVFNQHGELKIVGYEAEERK